MSAASSDECCVTTRLSAMTSLRCTSDCYTSASQWPDPLSGVEARTLCVSAKPSRRNRPRNRHDPKWAVLSSHLCSAADKPLSSESSHVPPASAVVAADWLRLDGSMET